MPGIFSLVTHDPNAGVEERLDRGAHRLLRHPWHHAEKHVAPQFGIASIQREGRLSGGDLWVSPDRALVVAIDGELYKAPSITGPEGNRYSLDYPTSRCAAHIAALYRDQGNSWVRDVSGAFAVVIFDRNNGQLWLFTDRYGLRPLAYCHISEAFIIGSTMACFTAGWPGIDWTPDWSAVADWFTFEHVLGEKTFLKRVKLLPNAGCLRYDLKTGTISVDQYWTLQEISPLCGITLHEAVEESCRLFHKAVVEQSAGDIRIGVYLTSGLDSRTTAGFLAKQKVELSTFTYGATGCRDMVWGADLARKMGSRHFALPLDDGRWIPRFADAFHAPSESFANCYKASHGIRDYRAVRDIIDVHLSGYGGGSFAGGDTTTIGALSVPTNEERVEELYADFVYVLGNVYHSPMERYYLFHPDMRASIFGRAEASIDMEFYRYAHLRRDIMGDAFVLNNRYKKFFSYLIAVERDYFEDRSPFMDYDFMDFLFAIPTSLRLHRQLQLGMLDYALPEMTTVPWQVTTSPPTLDRRRLKAYERRTRLMQWMRRCFGGPPLPFEPGRNYAKWLREDGLAWSRRILESTQLEQRGILNRLYLSGLIDRVARSEDLVYPEQRNLAFCTGAAISFEIMCRMVLDGAEPKDAVDITAGE